VSLCENGRGRASVGWGMAVVVLALVATVLTAPHASALPAGRAYERVTPADKNGGDVGGPAIEGQFASALGQAATDGDSIGYVSLSSFADAVGAEVFTNYVSTRGGDGWSTHAISPPAAMPIRFFALSPFRFFASDLSTGVLEWASPALAPEAPPDFASLYLRDVDDGYRVITTVTPPNLSAGSYRVTFAGATPDLRHIVFEANDALTPGAPPAERSIYDWTGSALRLVSILPGGEAMPGAGTGDALDRNFSDVISRDGSRIFWTAAGQPYVREDGTSTAKLNASRRAVSIGDGNATLLAATPDGSKAFFIDATALTDAPGDNGGLYEYDVDTDGLRNLTPNPAGDPQAEGVLGVGENGDFVHFVARAALAAGAQAGAPNLYVARDGAIEFVATLAAGDAPNWSPILEARTARVTPDGTHLVFLSTASLTGYDNTDPVSGQPHRELFLYDATEDRLLCVSCNPSGARPIGKASLPVATSPSYLPRVLSDDGSRVLFESEDALVPTDTNRRRDVYEFVDGRAQLISSGTSGDLSALVDVSPSGRDVFFTTRARLLPVDRDSNSDIYDARIGGGFPIASGPLPCEGEACRSPFSAPVSVAPPPATAWPGRPVAGKRGGKNRSRCHRRHRPPRGHSYGASGSWRCVRGGRR
jgi:hypothetical protein